jgi:hypothetical protein
MNDEQNNNQDDSIEPTNEVRVDNCTECKKNPCICPNKHDDSNNETVDKEKAVPDTNPPKISWI